MCSQCALNSSAMRGARTAGTSHLPAGMCPVSVSACKGMHTDRHKYDRDEEVSQVHVLPSTVSEWAPSQSHST